jgi:purine-binding chemotaxis protein CheW
VADQTKDSRIVVVDIRGEDIGLMVDAVTEVMRLTGDAIEPASDLITTEDSYYISGIAKLGDELLILLDLDKVLSKEERTALAQAKDTVSAKAGVA